MLDGSNHGVDGPSQAQSQPSTDEVRAELERLLASLDLPARGRKFLRYVVEETLAGRADRIKAYSAGTVVFGRDPSFDAQSDPVVRIEAGRLRRALEHYYLVAGLSDPVIIDVPKGVYVPHFTVRAVQESNAVEAVDPPSPAAPLPETPVAAPSQPRRAFLLGLGALPLVAAVAWWGTADSVPQQPVPSPMAVAPSGPILVVMPFANLGEGPEARIYAQGLTEEILGQLARFKELSVLGRETSRSIPPDADVARIHRELGVRYVLGGASGPQRTNCGWRAACSLPRLVRCCGRRPMTTICAPASSSRSRTTSSDRTMAVVTAPARSTCAGSQTSIL